MSETKSFNWLGRTVEVTSDSDFLTTQIGRLWGDTISIQADPALAPLSYHLSIAGSGGPIYRGPSRTCRLDPAEPEIHGYNLLIADLFGQVSSHFVLHATTVCRNGRALIVSGPSTFGKTTLGIQLASREFSLLADDVTLVDRKTGKILPFTRPFRLRPGTRDRLPAGELAKAKESASAFLEQEWAVRPDPWIAPDQEPCPASMVVILRPREEAGNRCRTFPFLEIRVLHDSRELLEEVRSLDGVLRVQIDPSDGCQALVEWKKSEPLRRWLDLHQDQVVYAVKLPSGSPSFNQEPELKKLSTFQAAIELSQEMQNRHAGSALAAEFQGDEVSMVTELAEKLRGVRCWSLLPGRLDSTLTLLADKFEETIR